MTRALLALLLVGGVASAQSKRYPPEPVDKDELEAQKSELWEQATKPVRVPYQALVKDAQQLLAEARDDATRDAIGKLTEAIALMPSEAEAHRLRGDAYVMLQDWPKCAADYDAAWSRLRRDPEATNTADLRRRLGLCQARAGKLADAERTLAEAAATGVNSVEIWMRLGEVRIAMGKLEGAIAALEAALQQTDISGHALVKWLLAGAYDRARMPSEAREQAKEALAADRTMSTLKNPTIPLLGAGEEHYLLGLAYEAHPDPRAEQALVQFRRFLAVAGENPWRKRAEEHIRELRTARLPDYVERLTGNAPYDERAVRDLVRKHMPAMRACLAKTPYLVLEVKINKRGPKGPDNARWRAPPENVEVRPEEMYDTTNVDKDTAIRCVEPIARRMPLPKPREQETYYSLRFRVVSP